MHAGLEYELLLMQRMREEGVEDFWTEADLRAQGFYKTPDVRLQVPFAVLRQAGEHLKTSHQIGFGPAALLK